MGFNRNLILYACIAKEKTILAEFNAKDHPDLSLLALKCLEKTPPLHSVFSHTIRGKTYMFLIIKPFTYFAIYDENLENPIGLAFLDSIKEAFSDVGLIHKELDSLCSHCFQGEFNPVFHQLLTVSGEMEVQQRGVKFVPERTSSMDSTKRIGKVPLLSDHGEMLTLKKKKKRRFLDDLLWMRKAKDRGERKVDVCDDDDSSCGSMHNSNNNNNNRGLSCNQSGLLGSVDPVIFEKQAKKSWQKHVWIVLSLDLVICLILFSVWLWVCRGFKCIDG
ncbi:hypothetical protein LIER_35383 [Lithospermum erythrorhizon]|uniref:Longin domain-containing protein n=1 Tax=Lithospermum erythrorhizon TaxID=34254 RepID=A0AAV3NR28_LITER